jgi:hypothetical protein
MFHKRMISQIFIVFLSFCSMSVLAQKTMTATEFLATAYQASSVELLQEKIKYQLSTDHSLPIIKEMEIRAEFNSFNWAEQEYALRAEFNTKRQRKAQDEMHDASSTANSLTQQVEIKKAMANRYQWLVKWLKVSQLLESKKTLQSLYQDQLIYLKRTVGDIDFEVRDLVKAEEEVLDISYEIIQLQNQKDRLNASLTTFSNNLDSIKVDPKDVISNEQIWAALNIGNLDSTEHSELAKRSGRLDLLEKEKEVELSELNNPLKFAQIKMNDYDVNDSPNEYLSIGFSFKLPFKGTKQLDLNELELEKLERVGAYEILKKELATEQTQLETNIRQLIQQKKYLQEQQENSQAKYVLERLLELEDAKALDILKLKEILLKRKQRIERLDFDILEDYIKWLNVSDKMMELPRKNHLLAMPELLKQ